MRWAKIVAKYKFITCTNFSHASLYWTFDIFNDVLIFNQLFMISNKRIFDFYISKTTLTFCYQSRKWISKTSKSRCLIINASIQSSLLKMKTTEKSFKNSCLQGAKWSWRAHCADFIWGEFASWSLSIASLLTL